MQVTAADATALVAAMGGDEDDLRKVFVLETIYRRLNKNG
jgi:hypothetical protein